MERVLKCYCGLGLGLGLDLGLGLELGLAEICFRSNLFSSKCSRPFHWLNIDFSFTRL